MVVLPPSSSRSWSLCDFLMHCLDESVLLRSKQLYTVPTRRSIVSWVSCNHSDADLDAHTYPAMKTPSAHGRYCCHFAHSRTATKEELDKSRIVVQIIKALPKGIVVACSPMIVGIPQRSIRNNCCVTSPTHRRNRPQILTMRRDGLAMVCAAHPKALAHF